MTAKRGRRMPEWERRQFVADHGMTCSYCGTRGNPWGTDLDRWHLDHVVPVARGGANDVSNLTLACGLCNAIKGAFLVSELGAEVERWSTHVQRMIAHRDQWPTADGQESA